jgi:hypothetical protein
VARATILIVLEDDAALADPPCVIEIVRTTLASQGIEARMILAAEHRIIVGRAVERFDDAAHLYVKWLAGGVPLS